MMPADDPTWPVCVDQCFGFLENKWCDHIRMWFLGNRDARSIEMGTRICVPLWPNNGIFAEVSIDDKEVMPGTVRMAIVKNDLFALNEDLIEMGLWTQGEGRIVIASVIKDWFRGASTDSQCKSSCHGFREEQVVSRFTTAEQTVSNWTILMHEMCSPCYLKLTNNVSAMTNGISQATQQPQTRGQRAAMQQLRSRFNA